MGPKRSLDWTRSSHMVESDGERVWSKFESRSFLSSFHTHIVLHTRHRYTHTHFCLVAFFFLKIFFLFRVCTCVCPSPSTLATVLEEHRNLVNEILLCPLFSNWLTGTLIGDRPVFFFFFLPSFLHHLQTFLILPTTFWLWFSICYKFSQHFLLALFASFFFHIAFFSKRKTKMWPCGKRLSEYVSGT